MQINNIQNPSSAKTVTTIGVQTQNGATVLESVSDGTVVYTPVTLPSSSGSITVNSQEVGDYTTMNIALTIGNQVPSTAKILISIPKWEDPTLGQSIPGSMLDRLTSCSVSGDLTGNSPTCTTSISASATGKDVITVSNAFTNTGTFAAGKIIRLSLTQIRNPPTTKSYTGYEISTADSDGNRIESCSGLSLQVTQVGTLDSSTTVRLTGNTIVNQKGTYIFFISPDNPIPVGGWFRIIIPSTLSATLASLTFNPLVPMLTTVTPTMPSSTQIEIKNSVTSYINEGQAVSFTISGIQNPPTAAATSSFEIYTFDESNFGIEKMTSGLTIQATTGQLTRVMIQPVNLTGVLQYVNTYNIAFQNENEILTTLSLVIEFPIQFKVSTATCSIKGLNTGYSCSSNANSNTITIASFVNSQLPKNQYLQFSISNLYIRNPATTRTTSSFAIYTSLNGNKIDYDDSITFTATPVEIPSVSIMPNSNETNKDNVTYVFAFTLPGYISLNAYLVINIPQEVGIWNTQIMQNQCGRQVLSGFTNTSKLDCTLVGRQLTIKKGFPQISNDPPQISFNLPGFKNPRSMAPSSNFTIEFFDGSNQYPTFIKTNNSFVKMNSTAIFRTANISRLSLTNSDYTNYTFTIFISNSFLSSDYLIIQSPQNNSISFSNGDGNIPKTQCFGLSSVLFQGNLNCTLLTSKSVKIPLKTRTLRDLQSQTNLTTNLTILVTQVKNPPSTQNTSSFTITQYSSDGYAIESQSANISIKNLYAQELRLAQILITPKTYQVNQQTSYVFNFTPSNYQKDMLIYIYIPSELVVNENSINCQVLNGMSFQTNCTYFKNNRTLIISKGFNTEEQPDKISFQINYLTNPNQVIRTESFKFYTYTSPYLYALDKKDSNLFIDFNCSLPCKTCDSSRDDNTLCATCYSPLSNDANITDMPFLFSQKCYESCPTGTYSNIQDYTCTKCASSLCETCSNSEDSQCTKCVSDARLINGSCVKYSDAPYFLPFFIISMIWIIVVFVIMITKYQTNIFFTSSSLSIIGLCEYLMFYVQLGAYNYYGFKLSLLIVMIGGFLVNYIINFGLLIFYLVKLRNHQDVRQNKENYKRTHLSILIISLLTSNKFFKLLYSNFSDKQFLSIDGFLKDSSLKRSYIAISFLSLIPTLVVFGNAIYNIIQSNELEIDVTILIDCEVILISMMLLVFQIMEFSEKCAQKIPLINKCIHHKSSMRALTVAEKYNEVQNVSMISMPDMDYEKQLRMETMKKLISNLKAKQLKWDNNNEEEKFDGEASQNINKRRFSDPAPFSKDHKKSIHYQGHKSRNLNEYSIYKNQHTSMATEINLLDEGDDQHQSEDGDRKVMSYPLTPNREKRIQLDDRSFEPLTIQNLIPPPPIIREPTPKSLKRKDAEIDFRINTRDMSIEARSDRTQREVQEQMQKLQKEREEIERLNEELKQQRLQLEIERREIEKLRNQGPKSADGETEKEKLERIDDKQIAQTARGGSRKQNEEKKTRQNSPLPEVKESRAEMFDEMKRTGRTLYENKSQKSIHQLSRNRSNNLMGDASQKSYHSDIISPKPHKCHGQSVQTRQSIFKLRNGSRTSSVSNLQTSIKQINQQISNQNSSPKKTENQQVIKKTGTKIYYSDKSESSVDDLMDETPSNYNIPNGRLDGKSMGFRFGKNMVNLAKTPENIDIFGEQNKLKVISSKGSSKASSPLKKKKFRQDPDSAADDENEFSKTSTQMLNYGESNKVTESNNYENSRQPYQMRKKGKKQYNEDLSQISNNVSNLSFYQHENSLYQNQDSIDRPNFNPGSYTSQAFGTLLNKNAQIDKIRASKNESINNLLKQKQMSTDRIKALEVAYLTKLVPNKSPPRQASNTQLMSIVNQAPLIQGSSNDRIEIKNRGSNRTPDITKLTGVQVLHPPQINNFQY